MNVRIVTKDDSISYDEVLTILKDAFIEWLDSKLESTVSNYKVEDLIALTKNGNIFIAIDENTNELLGVCGYNIMNNDNHKFCYCSYLAVNNKVKSNGIGTLLLKKLIDYNQTINSEFIFLDTAVPAIKTVNFYKKNKFRIVGYESYKRTNYFSYIFRYQLKKPSKWNSKLYCRLRFLYSYIKIRLLKKREGYTLLGKFIYKVY